MTSNASLIGAAMLLVVLLAAYGYTLLRDIPAQDVSQNAQMANPAATHCVQLGGTLEIRDGVAGQAGYCHLSDGRVCEEWALFRDGTCVQ